MATEQTILRRPKFDLRFVTETSTFQVKYNSARYSNNYMTESIISMTSKNALEDDTAAFSFVLTGDMEWDKLLSENDLVILNIDPNEYAPNSPYKKDKAWNRTVVVGLVSEVKIEGSYGDNSKMYRITGQSFQKAFANFELRSIRQAGHATGGGLGWMDYDSGSDGEGGGFTMEIKSKSAAGAAKQIIKRFKQYMKYNFGDSTNQKGMKNFFEEKVMYSINSWYDDELLLDPLPITSFEGSLNQLIKEIAAPPFLEYYFDVQTGTALNSEKVLMTIRKTPFDQADWKQLPTYELRTRDVISENFGRTDLDAYSIYNVVPGMENEEQALMNAVPWYSEALVSKYGYKMLEVSSKFINFGGAVAQEAREEAVEAGEDSYENTVASNFGKRLYRWYANNPNFYSGDITVVGHPDYRIGSRLVYRNSKQKDVWEFYIESVEHSFSYDTGYTTTLGVTRGLRVKSEKDFGVRFSPPAGKPKRFKGGYLGEINLKDLEEHRKAEQAKIDAMGSSGDGNVDVQIDHAGVFRPADGGITSEFGPRTHPKTGEKGKPHGGIDISGTNKKIRAMLGGVVTTNKYSSSYGNYVVVNHGNVKGVKAVTTLYAHMASRSPVSPGQTVKAGQSLGTQGTTGSSTGIHLHFEVRENGKKVNPRKWVKF